MSIDQLPSYAHTIHRHKQLIKFAIWDLRFASGFSRNCRQIENVRKLNQFYASSAQSLQLYWVAISWHRLNIPNIIHVPCDMRYAAGKFQSARVRCYWYTFNHDYIHVISIFKNKIFYTKIKVLFSNWTQSKLLFFFFEYRKIWNNSFFFVSVLLWLLSPEGHSSLTAFKHFFFYFKIEICLYFA